MPKPRKIQTGLSLDPDLLDYVDGLAERQGTIYRRRPRSQIIALIIEEHANRDAEENATAEKALTA